MVRIAISVIIAIVMIVLNRGNNSNDRNRGNNREPLVVTVEAWCFFLKHQAGPGSFQRCHIPESTLMLKIGTPRKRALQQSGSFHFLFHSLSSPAKETITIIW